MLVDSIELTAVKTALFVRDNHGEQYLFVIPAGAILASTIYAALFMPETHGLSLHEIGKIYSKENIEVRYNLYILIVIIMCTVKI